MKKIAVLAAALLMFGCASTSETKMGSGNADFPTVVKEAKASIKKAHSVGGEWRDSKKYLKKAEKAAKAGDMEKAMKLALKAKEQGKLGYDQAIDQKKAGSWLF